MKGKWFKRILTGVLSAALCCGMLAGCGTGGQDSSNSTPDSSSTGSESVEKTYAAPDGNAEVTLKILAESYDQEHAFKIAEKKFKTKYPKVNIEYITYDIANLDVNELEKQQSRQMMGDGADIVEMDDYAFPQICDIYKVQQANAYVDLAQYFDSDPDWSWDGYSKAVVDGAMMGNQLYCLPLYFQLPYYITTDTLLAESGIDLKKCDTGIGLLKEFAACGERAKAGEGDFTVMDAFTFYPWYELLHINPVTFASGKGEIVWTEEFDPGLEAYKEFCEKVEIGASGGNQSYYERLVRNRNIVVYPTGFQLDFEGIKTIAAMEQKPVVIPVYTADGSGVAANLKRTVSISNACKNKELAYEFVKCLLSEDAQAMPVTVNNVTIDSMTMFQPIHQTAAKRSSEYHHFSYEVVDAAGQELIVSSSDYLEQYLALADQVVHTYMQTFSGGNMYTYFDPYVDGKRSKDSCYEHAKKQLEIYISE